MKYLLVIILSMMVNDPFKIGKINKVKREAKDAFQSGDYTTAIEKYKYLADSLGVKEDEILLNLAHAYYLKKDTANALTRYQSLTQSTKNELVSKADNQLGLITNMQGKAEQALSLFKQAIKADPTNNEARYNYEMLKKKLDQKNKEDQKKKENDKNKDKNKNQEPSEFAKKLKEQADRLVEMRQYKQAYELMMDGLKKDQTVSSYQKFIDRTKEVAEINK